MIDPCLQPRSPQLGFVAGVALVRATEDLGSSQARLKWPNDLVIGGAKCAGLLVEGRALRSQIGLRGRRRGRIALVRPRASAIRPPCYAATTAVRSAPPTSSGAWSERFDEALGLLARGDGSPPIRAAWLARAAGIGTVVRIDTVQGRREGAFEGLDADGRLLFRGAGGLEAIEAADLWISPALEGGPLAARPVRSCGKALPE